METVYKMSMEATLSVIGGKWNPLILCNLGLNPMRSGELKRRIPNVSQKVLTQQLRELETDHIINRIVFNEMPPKVIYALTDEGKTLKDVLIAMSTWGEKRIKLEQERGKNVSLLTNEYSGFLNL